MRNINGIPVDGWPSHAVELLRQMGELGGEVKAIRAQLLGLPCASHDREIAEIQKGTRGYATKKEVSDLRLTYRLVVAVAAVGAAVGALVVGILRAWPHLVAP